MREWLLNCAVTNGIPDSLKITDTKSTHKCSDDAYTVYTVATVYIIATVYTVYTGPQNDI